MRSKRSVVAWSIPVMLGLLGWANLSLAQEKKPEPPKPEPKKVEPPKKEEPKAAEKDIAETLKATPDLKQFTRLFDASGVAAELKTGQFTIFAPNDAAMGKKGNMWLDNLLKPENKSEAKKIVQHYIVKGKMTAADVKKAKEVKTMDGSTLPIVVKDDKVTLEGANVVKTDINAANGVIHQIDQVLEIKAAKPEPAPKPAAPAPKPEPKPEPAKPTKP